MRRCVCVWKGELLEASSARKATRYKGDEEYGHTSQKSLDDNDNETDDMMMIMALVNYCDGKVSIDNHNLHLMTIMMVINDDDENDDENGDDDENDDDDDDDESDDDD